MSEELIRISNQIICQYRKKYIETPSSTKLQILLYYAQSFNLAIKNKELFSEEFVEIDYPAIKEVFDKYEKFKDINQFIEKERKNSFIEEILDAFGGLEDYSLINMVNSEKPISLSKEDLKEYFKKQI